MMDKVLKSKAISPFLLLPVLEAIYIISKLIWKFMCCLLLPHVCSFLTFKNPVFTGSRLSAEL